MRIAFVDTYYMPVLADLPNDSYRHRMEHIRNLYFGTSFYYSDAFVKRDWEAVDIVGNDYIGRQLWCKEMGIPYGTNEISVIDQLVLMEPDVVYCQDLSFFGPKLIADCKQKFGWKFAAQHSCPWAGDDKVRSFDICFTSFPHYLPRISRLGVQTGLLPIAFGHQVLEMVPPTTRDLHVTFVGGLNGETGHWSRGTEVMNTIAEAIPRFKWWGYFVGDGNQYPALKKTYQGPAWGLDMYKIYARSQLVVNRHGEVAEGFANNMRMFEATGMGAMLLTEDAPNIRSYFNPGRECGVYKEPLQLCGMIEQLLWQPEIIEQVSAAGQARTMECHTYEKRLAEIEPVLRNL